MGLQGRGTLSLLQLTGEMSFLGSAARADRAPTGPMAGWQAAPGAAVLREQIRGSAEPLSSRSSRLPEAAQAAPGDAGAPGLTQHLPPRPRAGERGLEVRGHGNRPPLLVDLRLRLRLWHRRDVPPAPLPELRHQLPAAARPGHPHFQIAPGRPPVLPASPGDSEGPRAPCPLPAARPVPGPESRAPGSHRKPINAHTGGDWFILASFHPAPLPAGRRKRDAARAGEGGGSGSP